MAYNGGASGNGFVEYSKLNPFNHALSLTIPKSHKEGTKWQTGFSVVTAYHTFAAAPPNPNLYGAVTSVFCMPGGEAARKASN